MGTSADKFNTPTFYLIDNLSEANKHIRTIINYPLEQRMIMNYACS